MVDLVFVISRQTTSYIPIKRNYSGFELARDGLGYFAGTFPDGITTIAGRPISATVRVLLRTLVDGVASDGVLVAKTQSAPDGTWRIGGLKPQFKYDVVARYDGENDVIMSDVTPMVD